MLCTCICFVEVKNETVDDDIFADSSLKPKDNIKQVVISLSTH